MFPRRQGPKVRGRRGAAVPGLSRSDPPRGPRFNQGANSFQIIPNKTKQISLDFLGFIRPNRDFSKGYGQKNKKNRLASQVVCKTSQTALLSLLDGGRRLGKLGFDWRPSLSS
jgi:hypothetical protein